MTPEQCAAQQRECSRVTHGHIDELRREVKADVAAIREAVQAIDRNVAQIKGYLGLNGSGTNPRPHHRDSEEMDHLHRRTVDVLEAAEALTAARESDKAKGGKDEKPPEDWRVNIMWKIGMFLLTAFSAPILYAAGNALAKRIFG